jgi:CheY-like chemotaxis protein
MLVLYRILLISVLAVQHAPLTVAPKSDDIRVKHMFSRLFSWWSVTSVDANKPGDTLKRMAPSIPLSELIKRTRIVVIDDKKTEFPFDPLLQEGYAITHWKDVVDLAKLESGFFDIIVLDINGIGRKLDNDGEGISVLRHLKERNPSQVIVAYSGQSHDPERIQFFRLADQFVPKPTNMLTWKEILDNLIQEKISVEYYWNVASKMLREAGATDQQILNLERALVKAGKSGEPAETSAIIVATLGTLGKVANLATIMAKIISLLYGVS